MWNGDLTLAPAPKNWGPAPIDPIAKLGGLEEPLRRIHETHLLVSHPGPAHRLLIKRAKLIKHILLSRLRLPPPLLLFRTMHKHLVYVLMSSCVPFLHQLIEAPCVPFRFGLHQAQLLSIPPVLHTVVLYISLDVGKLYSMLHSVAVHLNKVRVGFKFVVEVAQEAPKRVLPPWTTISTGTSSVAGVLTRAPRRLYNVFAALYYGCMKLGEGFLQRSGIREKNLVIVEAAAVGPKLGEERRYAVPVEGSQVESQLMPQCQFLTGCAQLSCSPVSST